MGFLWRLIKKNVQKEVADEVSLQLLSKIKDVMAELTKQAENYSNILTKYGEVFKGFQGPNQYLTFIMEHTPVQEELIHRATRYLCLSPENLVVFIDSLSMSEVASQRYETTLESRTTCALGAIEFRSKPNAEIQVWHGLHRILKRAMINETWIPLSPRHIIRPLDRLTVEAPEQPTLHVIKAEPEGRTCLR
jgi:hypothetical protein